MAIYVFAGKVVRRGTGLLSNGVTATQAIVAPFLTDPIEGTGTVTINWDIPTRQEDGTTPIASNNAITSFNAYYTASANGAQNACPGGTGVVTVTGISASATSRAISMSAGTYWLSMSTLNGYSEGDYSEPIFLTIS
jgi:hypothetical protein